MLEMGYWMYKYKKGTTRGMSDHYSVWLLDVHVYKGTMRGMNDHYLVEGRVRVAERWRPVRRAAVKQMHVKVRDLRKKEKVRISGDDKIWIGKSRGDGEAGGGERLRRPIEEGIRGRNRGI